MSDDTTTKAPAAPPAQLAENTPAESKPAESRPATSKPAETKPVERKPSVPKPENKVDRFHPGMPSIPGVSNASSNASRGGSGMDTQLLLQIGGMAAAVVLVGALFYWWATSRSRSAAKPAADPDAAEQAVPVTPEPAPIAPVHEGPSLAASVDELSKPWDAKKFNFFNNITHQNIDAMVIRIPGGALWAFSLQVPFARCELEYVTDPGKITAQYKYKASHPMVVSPCDNTVYDPMKVGNLGGDTLARGEIVQGSALRPPLSIDVRVSGTSIIADNMEQ
jgi:hypothetical protein